jgi:hypothetical protein
MDTTTTIHGFKAKAPNLCDLEHWLVGRNGALTITGRKAGPDLFAWIEFRISNDGSVPGDLLPLHRLLWELVPGCYLPDLWLEQAVAASRRTGESVAATSRAVVRVSCDGRGVLVRVEMLADGVT